MPHTFLSTTKRRNGTRYPTAYPSNTPETSTIAYLSA
jgi:hypothetical protein